MFPNCYSVVSRFLGGEEERGGRKGGRERGGEGGRERKGRERGRKIGYRKGMRRSGKVVQNGSMGNFRDPIVHVTEEP